MVAEDIETGREPDGLCADRGEHRAHLHESETLGTFWCTADQAQREPYQSEKARVLRRPTRDV